MSGVRYARDVLVWKQCGEQLRVCGRDGEQVLASSAFIRLSRSFPIFDARLLLFLALRL